MSPRWGTCLGFFLFPPLALPMAKTGITRAPVDPQLKMRAKEVLRSLGLRIAQERAREAGCDGYLAKPVEPRRVAEEIRRWLGAEPAGATPDVIS